MYFFANPIKFSIVINIILKCSILGKSDSYLFSNFYIYLFICDPTQVTEDDDINDFAVNLFTVIKTHLAKIM